MATQTPIQGETRRNGYFCLFNRGGGSTQVFEQGRSRGESTRKGRPVLSESRLIQTSPEVFSISKPADTHQGLQTPIRGLQTLPSTTGHPWAELAASGDSGSAEPLADTALLEQPEKGKKQVDKRQESSLLCPAKMAPFPSALQCVLTFPRGPQESFFWVSSSDDCFPRNGAQRGGGKPSATQSTYG